jgi:YD repeat-containing protein
MKNRISGFLRGMLPIMGLIIVLLLPWTVAQGDTVQRSYTYDRAGRLIQADYGSGVSARYLYDRAGNLTDSEVTGPVLRHLTVNYGSGGVGSYITVNGSGFPANNFVRLSVNQIPLSPLVQCNALGEFEAVLFFDGSDPGLYVVEAMLVPDPNNPGLVIGASPGVWPAVSIIITSGGIVRPRESQAVLISVPVGSAQEPRFIFLPLIFKPTGQVTPPPAGVRFWIQADKGITKDGSNRVTLWADQSGNGFNVQSDAALSNQPLWITNATSNNMPAVRFSANTDMALYTANAVNVLQGTKNFTIFIVAKPGPSQATNADILDYNHANCRNFVVQQNSNLLNQFAYPVQQLDSTKFQVLTFGYEFAATRFFSALNGANRQSLTYCTQTYLEPSQLSVGGNLNYPSRVFNGDLAEIIVYSQALSPAEQTTVENNLKTRYGIQ